MSGAGELRSRFAFLSVETVTDDLGTRRGAPAVQFTVWGRLTALRGTEEVMASRLQSRQPCILRVRQSDQTRAVTADWQVRDDAGTLYAIRTVTDPDQRRAWFDILVESGVAA